MIFFVDFEEILRSLHWKPLRAFKSIASEFQRNWKVATDLTDTKSYGIKIEKGTRMNS